MQNKDPIDQMSYLNCKGVAGYRGRKANLSPNHSLKTYSKPRISRRDILRFMGGASVFSLLGCLKKTSNSTEDVEKFTHVSQSNKTSAEQIDCVVRPQQTEGPYFVDEGLNRSDIRTDSSNGSISQGIPLRLAIHVLQLNEDACIPLEDAIVDIWHCDAFGVYSDVIDRSFNTKGQKFLRGSQTTDSDGMVEFVTIYPGWYPGRAVHIHFKIRSSENFQQSYEFTSQLYFEDSLTNQVYAQSPYNNREQQNTPNERDGIFQFGGEQLTLLVSQDTEGYSSTFKIGMQLG